MKNLDLKYRDINDPWGLELQKIKSSLKYVYPIYKNYFKTEVHGNLEVEDKPYMVVSNHSGQIAIDGVLIGISFLDKINNPRILRPLVERFVIKLPFLADWFQAHGAVLGDRENCMNLIKNGFSPLVFPEGMKGISKNTDRFYKLQDFSEGFLRMALKGGVSILPVAVVGAEEFYPYVYHSKIIAKIFKLPTFPITPFFPLLGPLGAIPMPSPVDIHIGSPIDLPDNLDYNSSSNMLYPCLKQIKDTIQKMVDEGLATRRPPIKIFSK